MTTVVATFGAAEFGIMRTILSRYLPGYGPDMPFLDNVLLRCYFKIKE
jgi:hypothetical protein